MAIATDQPYLLLLARGISQLSSYPYTSDTDGASLGGHHIRWMALDFPWIWYSRQTVNRVVGSEAQLDSHRVGSQNLMSTDVYHTKQNNDLIFFMARDTCTDDPYRV